MKHCIIGAGFSGLPVAKRLLELGEEVEVLDRNPGIGGLWHTGVYRDAHIISSKHSTELPDFPMPRGYPDFPGKAQMQAYFEAYARAFHIDRHVRLGAEVVRVRRGEGFERSPGWIVTLASGEERRYRTVTVANGHNWAPRQVRHPGKFGGEILYSSAYRDFGMLEGKRVLVVGYGNTGCDIAVDAGRHAASASISMRSGTWFFPKTFLGVPMADIPGKIPAFLQRDAIDRLFGRLVARLTVGALSRYGVPKPEFRPFDKHPIVNTDLLAAIRHGRVKVRPDVERLDGSHVVFVDGTREPFDLVVYCCGYEVRLPMLEPDLVTFERGLPVLFMQTMVPGQRGLFVAGLGQARTGGGPLYQGSGYAIARLIAHEGRSREGTMAELERLPIVRALSSAPLRRLTGFQVVGRADMRSRGLGDASRRVKGLDRLADAIGAPPGPRPGAAICPEDLEVPAQGAPRAVASAGRAQPALHPRRLPREESAR